MNYLGLIRYPRSAADEIRGRLSTHPGPRSEHVPVCKIVSGGGLKDLMAGFFPHILLRNLNPAVFSHQNLDVAPVSLSATTIPETRSLKAKMYYRKLLLIFFTESITFSYALPWTGPVATDIGLEAAGNIGQSPKPTPPPKAKLDLRQAPGDSTCGFSNGTFCMTTLWLYSLGLINFQQTSCTALQETPVPRIPTYFGGAVSYQILITVLLRRHASTVQHSQTSTPLIWLA